MEFLTSLSLSSCEQSRVVSKLVDGAIRSWNLTSREEDISKADMDSQENHYAMDVGDEDIF